MSRNFALRAKRVILPDCETAATVFIRDGRITEVAGFDADADCPVETVPGVLMPGLVDSHVHINEPGRTDWEGFDTATHAAAAGGITTLVDMPLNCIPVTTTAAALQEKLDTVTGKLWVDCGYWGGITADNLDDLPGLLASGVLGAKSFTIHSGIVEFRHVDEEQLKTGMRHIARAGLVHLVHAEVDLPHPDHDISIGTSYANFLATRPKSWENEAIAMVIRVMRSLKAEGLDPRAHIVHLSSSEGLDLLREAREDGLKLTAETCPHYLTLAAETIPAGGTVYKCCPPIREEANRLSLWQGLRDGLIDYVVSDHSPCTPALKAIDSGDIGDAWGGISALQFGLGLLHTEGREHGFSLLDLAHLMAEKPAEIAGLGATKGRIAPGLDADFCVFDDTMAYTVTAECIKHRHKISPYIGRRLEGKVVQTWLRGNKIYADDEYVGAASGRSLLLKTGQAP